MDIALMRMLNCIIGKMSRKLSQYVDKVYIINLLSRKDRRKFMIEQLKDNCIYEDLVSQNKLEIVDAVKLPGFDEEVLRKFNERNGSLIGSTGLYCGAVEHYRTLKRALYYGYERVMILEDDACFLKDKEKIFDALDKMPQSFNILHMEGYYWPDENFPTEQDWMSILSDNVDSAYWYRNTDYKLWAAAALIYSKSGMEVIVNEQERIFSGPDIPTFFEDKNSYFYTYPLLIQENKDILLSDIMNYAEKADSTNVYTKKTDRKKYYSILDFK